MMNWLKRLTQSKRPEPKTEAPFSNDSDWIDYARLLNSIQDAVLVLDSNERILFGNRRVKEIFGISKDDSGAKTRLWEWVRDPEILGPFKRAIETREPHEAAVIDYTYGTSTDRKQVFLKLSVYPVLKEASSGKSPGLHGVIGFFHDVTELKRAEKMRIDFVANVSHELRTPLTAISGYLETMMDDFESGRTVPRRFLEILQRNADRLMNLVRDLLELSTLEAGTAIFEKNPFNPLPLTQKVKESLQGAAQKKNVAILEASEVDTVLANPTRAEQVLTNLLDNAVKYSGPGTTVTVRWRAYEGGVVLTVEDQGLGIGPEDLPRIFERFYRVDKARSRDTGGTGLGLAIVKHTMERHGGKVWVESQLGLGAKFFCWFPSV